MRTAGRELDARIERAILAMPKADTTKKAISIAESAVNHVVSVRMAKKQHMR